MKESPPSKSTARHLDQVSKTTSYAMPATKDFTAVTRRGIKRNLIQLPVSDQEPRSRNSDFEGDDIGSYSADLDPVEAAHENGLLSAFARSRLWRWSG